MPVLDADGQVIEGVKPRLEVKRGATLLLKVASEGATIETPDSIMEFEGPDEWLILPKALWDKTLAALMAADAEHFPSPMPPGGKAKRSIRRQAARKAAMN